MEYLKWQLFKGAIKAYEKMRFQESPDGSREMILTPERALQFLEEYKLRWG